VTQIRADGEQAPTRESEPSGNFSTAKVNAQQSEMRNSNVRFEENLRGQYVSIVGDRSTANFTEKPSGALAGRFANTVLAEHDPSRVCKWEVDVRGRVMIGIVPEAQVEDNSIGAPDSVWAFVTPQSGCGIGLRRWGNSTILCHRGSETRLGATSSRISCILDRDDRTLTFEDDGGPIEGARIENIDDTDYRFAAAVGHGQSRVTLCK